MWNTGILDSESGWSLEDSSAKIYVICGSLVQEASEDNNY